MLSLPPLSSITQSWPASFATAPPRSTQLFFVAEVRLGVFPVRFVEVALHTDACVVELGVWVVGIEAAPDALMASTADWPVSARSRQRQRKLQ